MTGPPSIAIRACGWPCGYVTHTDIPEEEMRVHVAFAHPAAIGAGELEHLAEQFEYEWAPGAGLVRDCQAAARRLRKSAARLRRVKADRRGTA